jgi:hypothetical protein
MKTLVLTAVLLVTTTASAGVRDNDDTCDVKVGPAATLLLPFFEVDVFGNSGRTTLFTITNISRFPQVAHVTLWTDWAFPVLTFNLYLTGYDVQAINLADVLVRSTIAPPNGTTSATNPGALSSPSSANLASPLDCANNPATLPDSIATAIRNAFTRGSFGLTDFGPCNRVGNVHANAMGYATIDVVAGCTARSPSDPFYYTNDLLFDNVLIGDYQQLGPHPAGLPPNAFDATGNPMVHIRAVPEGGSAGSNVSTGLPFTFYDRYTPATARTIDRRQPLPSTFAARYIQGGRSELATNLAIWREGFGSGTCATAGVNEILVVPEIVRFDERENPFVIGPSISQPFISFPITLPATSATSTANVFVYPALTSPDLGGWMYLNLNNGGSPTYSAQTNLSSPGSTTIAGPRPSQNWVTVTMFGTLGTNSLAAEFDAAPLGNGCSPAAFLSTANSKSGQPIGPAGGVFVCPPGPALTNGTTTQCTGTNVNPPP